MGHATDSIRGLLKGIDSKLGWLRGVDLNHRPLGYEPNELPGCSTPQFHINNLETSGSNSGPTLSLWIDDEGSVVSTTIIFVF